MTQVAEMLTRSGRTMSPRLVGVASVGDIATTAGMADVAHTLACIPEPSEPDH